MVQFYRLTERIVDPRNSSSVQAEQYQIFAIRTGHGMGTLDFARQVYEMDDDEYDLMVNKCGEYGRFKLGNLSRYTEVEIFPEHVTRLCNDMPVCGARSIIMDLRQGFITIRRLPS